MKNKEECPVCGEFFEKVSRHATTNHPGFMESQKQLILKYYSEGFSSRKIAEMSDVIYDGGASITRLLRENFSKDELEECRRERISSTLKMESAAGNRDWINDINIERVKSPEGRLANSEGLKKVYADGVREPLNRGLTKLNSERIAQAAIKTSNTLARMADAGELQTLFKSGSENPKWKEDRSMVSKPWRKQQDFQKKDRKAILLRANYCCQECGISAEQLKEDQIKTGSMRCFLECDHIIPISEYGERDWENNGQALCTQCHLKKTITEAKSGIGVNLLDETIESEDDLLV